MTNIKGVPNFAIATAMLAASFPLYAQEMVKIALPVANYGPLSAVYVADDLGYFREAGVQVQITAYRGGPAAQQALAAGEADITNHLPPGVALAVKKGVKQRIVGAGSVAADGWHLVVLKDSPIKSLKDIVGKKVGVSAIGSTTDFFSLWAAKKAGGDIERISVGPGGLIPALKGKQVDAATMFTPISLRMFVSGEGRSIVDYAKDLGPSLPDAWVASQAIIDRRPIVVEGVLKAVYKATRYMQQNRAYALKFLKQHTKEADDRVVELEYDTVISKRATEAMIRREWLVASLALAAGMDLELTKPEEISTDKFYHVKGD